jgi:uncharacterized protein (TIGR03083 family)
VEGTRATFLEAYDAVRPLLAAPALARAWNGPSSLPDLSVRGLAGHLVRAGDAVLAYLDADPAPPGDPLSPAAYYAAALTAMDARAHAAVRARGEALAGSDPSALVARREAVAARLGEVLRREPPERRVRVFGDLVMTLDDYLVTRIVEILVHADDLAVSLGLDAPLVPERAFELGLRTLVDVARARHGDAAVLVALARRERDHVDALRVFPPVARAPDARAQRVARTTGSTGEGSEAGQATT